MSLGQKTAEHLLLMELPPRVELGTTDYKSVILPAKLQKLIFCISDGNRTHLVNYLSIALTFLYELV
jgi:hypothetical protein